MHQSIRQAAFAALLIAAVAGCSQKSDSKEASAGSGKARPPAQAAPVISISNLAPSADSLLARFFSAFNRKDTAGAMQCIFQFNEYKRIYPYTPNADSNPNSPGFIAQLFKSANKKHIKRWLYDYSDRGLVFSRYTIGGPEEKRPGFEYIKGVRIFVKTPEGKEEEFPAFKTLVRINGGYKIWSILDT